MQVVPTLLFMAALLYEGVLKDTELEAPPSQAGTVFLYQKQL